MLTNATFHILGYIQNLHGGHRSRDRMVVRFTTTYAISSNSAHGEKKQNKELFIEFDCFRAKGFFLT
jgi:hypothetical protein